MQQMVAVFLLTVVPAADIKFKARGYFFARWSVRGAVHAALPGRLSLIARPEKSADFQGHHGFQVVLVNRTNATVELEAQDFRINVVREARDAAGRWRPIEYLPQSWCGLSYHRVYLRPGRHWSFPAPVYRGPFRTQMRFVLDQPGLHLVSNEFSGTINIEQFERRQGHTPANIMDPYDD
jgi:hypothetical protein